MSERLASAVPDVLGPGMRVVFCGINPGHWSARAGAAFANPRNDFWRLLHAAGFTPRVLEPTEQSRLLEYGVGLTNAAVRTTRGSGDLRKADFEGAAERLAGIAGTFGPRAIGFVGKAAYTGVYGGRVEHGLLELGRSAPRHVLAIREIRRSQKLLRCGSDAIRSNQKISGDPPSVREDCGDSFPIGFRCHQFRVELYLIRLQVRRQERGKLRPVHHGGARSKLVGKPGYRNVTQSLSCERHHAK